MPSSATIVRWVLPASLAFNVFLGAALFVHLRLDRRHAPPPSPHHLVEDMTRDLPPADAQMLRQALADSLKQLDAARRAEETLPRQLQDILRREPFDKAAFREQLEQPLAARQTLNQALSDAIERISPEGRHRLAEWQPPPPPGHPPGPPGPPGGFMGGPPPGGPPP